MLIVCDMFKGERKAKNEVIFASVFATKQIICVE